MKEVRPKTPLMDRIRKAGPPDPKPEWQPAWMRRLPAKDMTGRSAT